MTDETTLRDKIREVISDGKIGHEELLDRLEGLMKNYHPQEVSEDNPLMRPATVAILFDVSPGTVKRWIQEGNLPSFKINVDSGRPEHRVLKSDMVAFAKRRYSL